MPSDAAPSPFAPPALPDAVRRDAETILRYLGATDPLPDAPADAVIGFGVFDLSLPRFCAELHRRGLARRILFTGGIGAGTGTLGGPEADVWRAEVRRAYPEISDAVFVLENRSTNTAENIQFTAELLARDHPSLAFGRGLRRALIVASPSRLRRVRATLRLRQPALAVTRLLPAVDFAAEAALYHRQGVDYLEHLLGEIDRLQTYPARGWISPESVPPDVGAAADRVRQWRLSSRAG